MDNKKSGFLDPSVIHLAIISLSVFLGFLVRIQGLGTWTLALDEYYIIKSVQNILQHGLPQFPNGGYYERGLIMQYMIAPLLSLGVKPELAGRIFPLIANMAAFPALYLIARKIGNKTIATIVIIIFSFSIWEVEFARFIRMYAFFQTITIWYLYFALRYFETKNSKYYLWMLGLSALSIFVFAGSIFLAVFNFIPFLLNRKINYKLISFAIIIFAVSFFWNMIGFRFLDPNDPFPQIYYDFISGKEKGLPIKSPNVFFPFAFLNIFTVIATLFLLGFNIYIVSKLIKLYKNNGFWSIFSIIILALLAVFNQFGFFILAFLIIVFWKLLDIDLSDKKFLFLIALLFGVNLIYWFGFGLLTHDWYVLFDDFSSFRIWGVSKRIFMATFNYPDNYLSLLNYFRTLPILTAVSGLSMIILFLLLIENKEKYLKIRFLTGTLIFLALISSIPRLPYQETRYTFFIVPLLIILVNFSIYTLFNKYLAKKIIHNIAYIFTILLVFVLSKDFSAYHLINIDKADVNYRMIYPNKYKVHLYRRWDVKTPTDYIKEHLNKGDIIMLNENSPEFYLPYVDYFSFDYKHKAFVVISVKKGTRERWSNAKMIYTYDDLINFIENRKRTLWFIVFPENYLIAPGFYERYKENIVYQGIDGMLKVFRFPKE